MLVKLSRIMRAMICMFMNVQLKVFGPLIDLDDAPLI